MERYVLQEDVHLFGKKVPDFPQGIQAAFEELKEKLADEGRTFYGLCYCEGQDVFYIAAAAEKEPGEGSSYGYDHFTIKRGAYFSEKISGWPQKIPMIRQAFAELGQQKPADRSRPLVEIYWNMQEMSCLVPIDEKKEALTAFEKTGNELLELLASFDQRQLNERPSEGGWTAAQVGRHLLKSYAGIPALFQKAVACHRYPAEKTEQIKKDFLNFNVKFQAPEFILPENKIFEKERLLQSLKMLLDEIRYTAAGMDLSQTCTDFALPGLGEITRLEWIWFLNYHTQRHLHQLKKIQNLVSHERAPSLQ